MKKLVEHLCLCAMIFTVGNILASKDENGLVLCGEQIIDVEHTGGLVSLFPHQVNVNYLGEMKRLVLHAHMKRPLEGFSRYLISKYQDEGGVILMAQRVDSRHGVIRKPLPELKVQSFGVKASLFKRFVCFVSAFLGGCLEADFIYNQVK